MATKIRLKRTGARGNPHYRVVVMDSRKPRGGTTVEELGYYCPTTHPPTVKIDAERAIYWLSVGAQPTDTVRSLLSKQGILEAFRTGAAPPDAVSEKPVTPEAEAVADAAGEAEKVQEAEDATEATAVRETQSG